MNASEFNTELHKLVTRAVNEGIGNQKLSFDTVIGIIERQKYTLLQWHAALLLEAAAQNKPIIMPPNGVQLPPRMS